MKRNRPDARPSLRTAFSCARQQHSCNGLIIERLAQYTKARFPGLYLPLGKLRRRMCIIAELYTHVILIPHH
jgi:hypothetical protein